ncbi:hypothetical protein CC2G_012114 [Coprinopsis cinerea AmutBmut pab1-1]|nr:hypothetical protein CC2G_012114 [Coprinopsis cinerea AmutBmut pab1-1]
MGNCVSTSGIDPPTAIDDYELSGVSAQGEGELEGPLSRVNDLLDAATKEMDDSVLANAIALLRKTIRNEQDDRMRAKAEIVLIKALVARFARHGWVEDLDEGVKLSLRVLSYPTKLIRGVKLLLDEDLFLSRFIRGVKPLLREVLTSSTAFIRELTVSGSRGGDWAGNVSSALISLREYRQTIDVCKLETAVIVASEALASSHGATSSRGQLLLRTGSALVLKYLASNDERYLGLAEASFQDAIRVLKSGDPTLFIALLNLQHVASIKLVESKGEKSVRLLELKQLRKRMESEDEKGRNAYKLGTRMMNSDKRQVEGSISWLCQSLVFRPPRHPRHLDTLAHFANALNFRFLYTSDLRDLEESVRLHREVLSHRLPGHRDRPRALNDLATSLSNQFQHKGDFRDLEESIRLTREALSHHPTGHPDRPRSLHDLAALLGTRFLHKGDLCDLEECVAVSREALALRPPGHPDRPRSLHDLATSLACRFQHKADFRDLEESVTLVREALALQPPGLPYRPVLLHSLAVSLSTRFRGKGDLRDLEECVTLYREALALRPPGHTDRPRALNDLAASLDTRFQHKGDFRDLEESVTLHREVLTLRLPGHPDRPRSLNDLATSLGAQFHHKGDFRDLEESIALAREALTLLPPGHPDHPRSLNDLATSLGTRFQHKNDFRDLEESIALVREALTLQPPGHPYCPVLLHSLAFSLLTRFQRRGDLRDLEECVTLERQALDLRPAGHPEHRNSLNSLAQSLSARFEHTGDFRDLEECIAFLRDALLLYSKPDISLPDTSHELADHPYRIFVIGNLVRNLNFKYRATNDNSALDEIFQLLRSGAQSQVASPLARLRHARLWSSTCREFDRSALALEAYDHGVAILPHLASLDLTLEQRQNVLVHAKDLSRDAVQCAIEQGQLDTAVVFLSTARSIFWSQALQFRGSFDRLDALHPELASDLRSVTRQLEIATDDENLRIDSTSAHHDLPRRPYLLAQRREEIITQIRAIDGFHDFLLPPSFDTLKSAARDGSIVFLNASKYGCDVLIMKPDGTLHRRPLSTDLERIAGLTDAIEPLSRGQAAGKQLQRKIDSFCETETRNTRLKLRRKNRGTAEDDFKELLEILWDVVAEPVIRILGLQKTDNPQRIWWCPTGPFAFLPIHAAGIYANNPEASDCLSDYVVSSYCSSPQDLIAPPPTPNLDYEMLVVVEPGDSGPSRHRLPFTMEELKKIQRRIPHERHLVTRIGSAETPSNPDTILGHINSASIVHFGCHGSQDSSNPLDSSLILSGVV